MEEKTLKILAEKLKPDHISSRSKSGLSLSYIESHHAIREANRAFGFDGWSYGIMTLEKVSEEKNSNNNHVIGYISRVMVEVGGKTREDVGFGSGISKSLADAHEGATKEAVSDAMKRALRTFGDIFGLALYDKKQEHVEKPVKLEKKDHVWKGNSSKQGGSVTEIDIFLLAIDSLETKASAHSWKDENQKAIDGLGADKGTVMTKYLSKVKELK